MKIRALLALSLFVSPIVTMAAFAEEPTTHVTADDYRITVATNKNVYHHRDVMNLTVGLLNEGPNPLRIVTDEQPAEEEGQALLEPGVLDDESVDVEILPPRRPLVGFVTITPLHVHPDADQIPVPKRFRLPLLGSPLVTPHSTRILSSVNILVFHAGQPEPEIADDEPELAIPLIPAVGTFEVSHPGPYLLTCVIKKIDGTRVAVAQRIIDVRPRRVPPQLKLTAQNHEMLQDMNGKMQEMTQLQKNTYRYAMWNNHFLQYILRHFLGIQQP